MNALLCNCYITVSWEEIDSIIPGTESALCNTETIRRPLLN